MSTRCVAETAVQASSTAHLSRRAVLFAAVAGLGFALAIYATLPAGLLPYNDDFGYIRSVLETLRRGRPWTDDWLEPWSASLSLLSATVYRLTGSFRLATHGVQVALAGSSFALLALLLTTLRLRPLPTLLAATAVLGFPTVLFKQLEFTAFVLYLPCLLVAAWSAVNRRWLAYGLAMAVAIASRQSAIAWAVLPALYCLAGDVSGRPGSRGRAAAAVILAGVTYVGCAAGMNVTHSQQVLTSRLWETLTLSSAAAKLPTVVALGFCAAGLANVFTLAGGRRAARSGSKPAQLAIGIAGGIALIAALRWRTLPVETEHPLFALWHGSYLPVAVGIATLGWIAAPVRIDGRWALAAAASGALTLLRPTIWDYYLVDVAVFIVVGVLVAERTEASTPIRFALPPFIGVGALAVLAALNVVVATEAKREQDEAYATGCLYENALTQASIGAHELDGAPFGLIGWHLHPYFIRHEGAGSRDIAGFGSYLAKGAVGVERRLNREQPKVTENGIIVARGVFPVGWRHQEEFVLHRRTVGAAAAPHAINPREYMFDPLPLNDREWRAYIDGGRSR